MRLQTPHGVLEGDPAEIARLLDALNNNNGYQTRLLDPPTDERLLHDYAHEPGLTRKTRASYLGAVHRLSRQIAPKTLLDATVDDIRQLERRLLEECRSLQYGGAGPAPLQQCRSGLYSWTPARPASCCGSCPLFARQETGPRAILKGLKHFYGWLRDRGLVREDPVGPVLRRHSRSLPELEDGRRKYCPTVTEVRALLRAAEAVLSPVEVALLLVLAKTGRRPGHVLLLDAGDVTGLDAPDGAWVSFRGVRDRVLRQSKGGRSKLRGNLLSPLDEETRHYLRDHLLPYRARRWLLAPTEGPLFPAPRGGRWTVDQVRTRLLVPAIRHLADTAGSKEAGDDWRARAAPKSPQELLPGSFRHFFTTTLGEAGVPRDERQRLRGDVVPGSIEAYDHVSPQRLRAGLQLPSLLAG